MLAAVRARYSLPQRYILSVGTIEPRKNLGRVLSAFERLHGEGLVDALVIAGKKGWLYDDFFAQLDRSPVKHAVIFPGWVSDEDLPAVYAGAAAVAFPSEFEGFGLPVLEGMACGAPVVCSNTSSLPEIAGDAALLVDPADTDAIGAPAPHPLRARPGRRAAPPRVGPSSPLLLGACRSRDRSGIRAGESHDGLSDPFLT